MAARISVIASYDESEDFETYVYRVELFFLANSINDEKLPQILSLLDAKVYGLLQNLVSPKKLKDCLYNYLVKMLINPYKPTVIVNCV